MKIGKTGLLLLAVGIPVVLLGTLGMSRSRQSEVQQELGKELSLAKQRLSSLQAERLSPPQKGTDQQIKETTAALEAAKISLSPILNSIMTSDRLLAIAKTCGVTIKQMDSPGLASQDLYGIKCATIAVTLTAEGEVPNLVDFVQKLNNEHTSGMVESVNISIPEKVASSEPEVTTEESPPEATGEEGQAGAIGAEEQTATTGEEEQTEVKVKEKLPQAKIKFILYAYQGK